MPRWPRSRPTTPFAWWCSRARAIARSAPVPTSTPGPPSPPSTCGAGGCARGHRVMDRLEGLRQPTIAALNGIAYGGGLELALACDLRIAADTVKVAAPEVGIGTIPGWGMTTRLAVVAGPARAKQMILTGRPVDARRAETWGVLSEVVAAGGAARGHASDGRAHRRPGAGRRPGRQAAHRRPPAPGAGVTRVAGQRAHCVHRRRARRPRQLPRAPARKVRGVVMDYSSPVLARRSLDMADGPTRRRVAESAPRRDCIRVEAPERALEAATRRSGTGTIHPSPGTHRR